MIKKCILLIIRYYQKILSFDHGFVGKLFPYTRFCKFTPTCSDYGYLAIEKHGALKGMFLLIKRVVKCNPWGQAGRYDPVP